MESLNDLVVAAQAGDMDAYGRLVQATQTMAYAVAVGASCAIQSWRRMRCNRPICERSAGSEICMSRRRFLDGFGASRLPSR